MIDTILMQYGILGVWTFSLLMERYSYNTKIKTVVENNTIALIKIYGIIRRCKKK